MKNSKNCYQVCQIGASLRQGVQRNVGDSRAAAEVQPLQLVAGQRKTLAGAIAQLLAVLQVQRFDGVTVLA